MQNLHLPERYPSGPSDYILLLFRRQRGHSRQSFSFMWVLIVNLTAFARPITSTVCGKAPLVDTIQGTRQIMGIIPCSADPKLIKLLYHDDSTESYRFRSNEGERTVVRYISFIMYSWCYRRIPVSEKVYPLPCS